MRVPVDHLLNSQMQAPAMRSLNGIQLLNLLRQHGPVSRAGLAKLSRLSKPTVSEQIAGLVRRGLVTELGPGESGRSGGKKPTMLEFHAGAGRVAAVEIGPGNAQIAIADLSGNIQERDSLMLRRVAPQQAVRTVRSRINSLLGSGAGLLSAIGVAVPGQIDPVRRAIIEADNLPGWENVNFAAGLGADGVAVRIDNDVNLAAVGEWSHTYKRSAENLVLVRLGRGLGAGVIVNGALHRGTHFAAGEIGHMLVGSLDLHKSSPRGHLELAVGADRIASLVRKMLPPKSFRAGDELQELLRTGPGRHPGAKRLLDETAVQLGISIANLIAALDPGVVVLSGAFLEALQPSIEQTIKKLIPWPVNVRVSKLGAEAAIRGALDLALESAYQRIALSLDEEPAAAAAATGT